MKNEYTVQWIRLVLRSEALILQTVRHNCGSQTFPHNNAFDPYLWLLDENFIYLLSLGNAFQLPLDKTVLESRISRPLLA